MMLITKNARVNDLQRALRLHQAGELNAASDIYADILRSDPNNPDALHLLGLIAYQQGRATEALDLVRRAIALNDADAYYHNNLGEILQQQGCLTEAIASFTRALELFPEYEEAKTGLADAQRRLKENSGGGVDGAMRVAYVSDRSPGVTSDAVMQSGGHQVVTLDAGFTIPANIVDKSSWIADVVKGKSFADIGGLWGTVNEMVTVAAHAGAARTAMVDMQPIGNEWWQAFVARCDSLGIKGYESYYANLEDADLVKKIGAYDVVHCSGILYHAPDPMHLLRQLFRVTNEYLILTTMAIPDTIPSAAGDIKIGGAVYFVPTLNDADRKIFSEFFDAANIKIAGINGDPVRQWVDAEGSYDYGPWWWLWTPDFVMNMLQLFPCEVIAHGESWAGRSYSYLCRKKHRA